MSIMNKCLITLFKESFGIKKKQEILGDCDRVPILTYHSWTQNGISEAQNDSVGLINDLEVIHDLGYTIVPVKWLLEWAFSDCNAKKLPKKAVGITFDDGNDSDWFDIFNKDLGVEVKSFYNILKDFKEKYKNELADYSPHATSFVIASSIARKKIAGNGMKSSWWVDANNSGIISIQNHSTDHDHGSIKERLKESDGPLDGLDLPIGGSSDGLWYGKDNFLRINNENTAKAEIISAAKYIESKTGIYPDLFCYPYGSVPDYLINDFFINNKEHKTYAAFTTESAYLTKDTNRFLVPRFVRGAPDGFCDKESLIKILKGA